MKIRVGIGISLSTLFLNACSADLKTVVDQFDATSTQSEISVEPELSHLINLANVDSYILKGSCSVESATIDILVGNNTVGRTSCQNAHWKFENSQTQKLQDGQVSLQFKLIPPNTLVLPSSVSFDLLKDTVAPQLKNISPAAGSIITAANQNAFSFSGSCTENNARIIISIGNQKLTETLCKDQSFQTTPLTSLPEGTLNFTFKIEDGANNSSSFDLSILKDTSAPQLRWTSPTEGQAINASSASSFSLSGTCSENNRSVEIKKNGTAFLSTICVNQSFSISNPSIPDATSIQLSASQTDALGNTSSASVTFSKDVVAPTLTITSPTENQVLNSVSAANFKITGTCSENTRVVSLKNVATGASIASPTCQSGAFDSGVLTIADGVNIQIRAEHSDAAGNTSSVVRTFTKDTTAPTLTITSPTENQVLNSVSAANFKITGTCSENTRVVSLKNVATGASIASPTCQSGAFDSGVLTIADGVNIQIRAEHSDAAGNTSSVVRTFTKDTTSPALTITSPTALTEIDGNQAQMPTVTGSCSENGRSISLTSQGSSLATATCTNGSYTSTALNLASVPEGSFTLVASLSDAAGNSASVNLSLKKYTLRNISLTPTVIPPPTSPKFKVVFIVDNSASMANEQQYLAAGVNSLMNRFKNADGSSKYDIDFYIHTTSSTVFGGNKQPHNRGSTYKVSNDVTFSTYAESPSWPNAASNYQYFRSEDFSGNLYPSYSNNHNLSIRKGTNITTLQSDLVDAISKVGTSGSDWEAGLCTMGRILAGSAQNNIIDAGDKVAFVILSDTDDYTAAYSPFYCSYSTTTTYPRKASFTSAPTTIQAEADFNDYTFQGHHFWYTFDYDCQSCSDGICGPIQKCTRGSDNWSARIDPVKYSIPSSPCTATPIDCPAQLKTDLGFSGYRNPRNCKVSCTENSNATDYLNTYNWSNAKTLTAVNLCSTSFTYSNETFTNIQDYMEKKEFIYGPGTCTNRMLKLVPTYEWDFSLSTSSTSYIHERIRTSTTNNFVDAIYEGLQSKLGSKNYIVTALINDDDIGNAQCRAEAEGMGKKYRELVNKLGSSGSFSSICDTDYYTALEPIKTFFEANVQVQFDLTLNAGESVYLVSLQHSGQPATNLSTSDWTYSAGKLKIRDGLVQAGDTLTVVIRKG